MNKCPAPPLIELKNAGVLRENKWLVRGIDLTLSKGEILTLIGPNGSGKSTTAKLALGVLKPDEGEARRPSDMRVGYVPQKIAIDWTIPLSCGRFMQLSNQLDENELVQAMALTGILHMRHEQVHTLSGGEFQRLLLARAIARKPDVLVLDEPVQGVDYTGEIALYNLITQIRDELNCAILLISHDLHVVMAQTDRVLCLNGQVCCHGPPQTVIQSEAYKQLFGVKNSETLALYQHGQHASETTPKDKSHAG